MGGTYADWHRKKFVGPQAATSDQQLYGRKVLGALMEQLRLSGLPTGVLRVEGPDGTKYVATYDGTTPTVSIEPVPQPAEENPAYNDLWIPRGFVVYPAWSDAKYGRGLPVVFDPDSSQSPYSLDNMAPGLETKRWTAKGPCGEMLLSPDKDAGYPPRMRAPAPLLWDDTWGPHPLAILKEIPTNSLPEEYEWQDYRPEFDPFLTLPDPGWAQGFFDYTNTQRGSGTVVDCTYPFRGYANIAYCAADVLSQFNIVAAESLAYPDAYGNSAIRTTKEGYQADAVSLTTGALVDRTHTPRIEEVGGIGLTAQGMYDAWDQAGGSISKDVGPSVLLYAAQVGGFQIADMAPRDRWIQAGNMTWTSKDPALPPITYHGFRSLNLAFETWPVRAVYTGTGENDTLNPTTPLEQAGPFTDDSGDAWLRYPRGDYNGTVIIQPSMNEPAMGPHVYCQGRAIAVAPNAALVWGACVQRNGPKTDRLIILTHHRADEPADFLNEGPTRYFRVWWVDIPYRENGLRMAPPMAITGTDPDDPWGWKGGEQFDVGSMPNTAFAALQATDPSRSSLKYFSQWQFKHDGTGASCLRDYGSYIDYRHMGGATFSAGIVPRRVELKFEIEGPHEQEASSGSLTTTLTFHDVSPWALTKDRLWPNSTPPLCPGPFKASMTADEIFGESTTVPMAVGYDKDDNLRFVLLGHVAGYTDTSLYTFDSFDYSRALGVGDPDHFEKASVAPFFFYVGLGDEAAEWVGGLQYLTLCGAGAACEARESTLGFWPLVLDVESCTLAVPVIHPMYRFNGQNYDPNISPSGDNQQLQRNSAYMCELYTSNKVHGVQLWREGVLTHEDWYPNPDGMLYDTSNIFGWYYNGYSHYGFVRVWVPLTLCDAIQPFYCERFGQRIYGYQFSPLPQAAVYVNQPVPSQSWAGCTPLPEDILDNPGFSYTMQNPRGGAIVSTLPLQDPKPDWLIYAKVV